MKPICVPCQRFYRPEKNGFSFVEGMPKEVGAPSGTAAPELWQPYKLWRGDLWKCPGCGHLIISGVAPHPVAAHYQPDFEKHVDALEAKLQINDC